MKGTKRIFGNWRKGRRNDRKSLRRIFGIRFVNPVLTTSSHAKRHESWGLGGGVAKRWRSVRLWTMVESWSIQRLIMCGLAMRSNVLLKNDTIVGA